MYEKPGKGIALISFDVHIFSRIFFEVNKDKANRTIFQDLAYGCDIWRNIPQNTTSPAGFSLLYVISSVQFRTDGVFCIYSCSSFQFSSLHNLISRQAAGNAFSGVRVCITPRKPATSSAGCSRCKSIVKHPEFLAHLPNLF